MDEDTAGTRPARAVAPAREVGARSGTVATTPDEDPRRRFDRAVGDATGAIARELILPIERFPPGPRPAA